MKILPFLPIPNKIFFLDITASSPYIAQELTLLKKAFNDERSERLKLQAAEMKKILNNLAPIHVPQPKDDRIIALERDLVKVKNVTSLYFATAFVRIVKNFF